VRGNEPPAFERTPVGSAIKKAEREVPHELSPTAGIEYDTEFNVMLVAMDFP
jgi:hypothetical protein